MQILVRWAISAVALYITVLLAQHLNMHIWLAPGVSGVVASVIAVAVLAVVNAVIRPIVKLLEEKAEAKASDNSPANQIKTLLRQANEKESDALRELHRLQGEFAREHSLTLKPQAQ